MLESIPINLLIPALVFLLVFIVAVFLLTRSAKGRTAREHQFSLAAESFVVYQIPENYGSLEASEKRLVTIQNLYLNYGRDLESIAGLLEVDRGFVEEVLVKLGHLRQRPTSPTKSLTHACFSL
jgi:hypothetical protein